MNKLIALFIVLTMISCSRQNETRSMAELKQELAYILQDGDTLKAIKILDEFNLINPDNIETQGAVVLLKMRARLKSKEESQAAIRELYLKDSTNKWIQQLNSSRLIEEGTTEEGLAEIEKRIKMDPADYWNYLGKGRKLIELKKYDEAIVAFNKAIELEPVNRYAYADRALAKYMKGDKEEACEDWKTPGGGSIMYREKYCK